MEGLLQTVAQDRNAKRQTDWAQRDLALVLTALLAGLRADELRQCDIGDIRTTEHGGAVIHVKGKRGKQRSVPIEPNGLCVQPPTLVWSRDEGADVDEVVDVIGMPVSGLGDGDTAE